MKNKTLAAKILLEHGWTFEEVQSVLGSEKNVEYIPYYPYYPSVPYWWQQPTITYRYTVTDGTLVATDDHS